MRKINKNQIDRRGFLKAGALLAGSVILIACICLLSISKFITSFQNK